MLSKPKSRAVARQQLGDVDVERRADRESRCRTRCGSGDGRRSGRACCVPAHARSSEPASQPVNADVLGLGRDAARPAAASRARSACGARVPTSPRSCSRSSRLAASRLSGSFGRLRSCGCCGRPTQFWFSQARYFAASASPDASAAGTLRGSRPAWLSATAQSALARAGSQAAAWLCAARTATPARRPAVSATTLLH